MSQQCVRFVEGKFYLNDSGLSLKVKNDKINQKVFKYNLLHIQDQITLVEDEVLLKKFEYRTV
ncbi:MAG: hypothetical protein CM15mP96_1190 [Gammaproteobacteria bacterium]|nr:MAG: hypothetical protein CM15mP96_1190 [Gammaproteobacteria bacterium]